jgi:hypothetical protein
MGEYFVIGNFDRKEALDPGVPYPWGGSVDSTD